MTTPNIQKTTWEITRTKTRLRETREQLVYWQRQQALRTDHQARIQAGARVLLYQSQLRTLNSKLDALTALA